ncbi:MAG: dephospho-CoA kinase [Rhodanobacteraceae bacterium]|nr:MAG: dephospho-CoA kinase [Rhodanobacteraceae bacterium]
MRPKGTSRSIPQWLERTLNADLGAAPHAGPRPYVVALTGGIAAGKSAVGQRFQALGIEVYDADRAAREVVAPGTGALAEIERAFGPSALKADGSLNRHAMRERVFADPAARRRLEAIVHPRVRGWLQRRAGTNRGPYCVLAIPLLVETRADYAWVDRVLLVDAPESLQIQRLIERDGVTREIARQMLAAQSSRAARQAIADDSIVNDGNEAALDAAVAALHARYLELASTK